MKLCLGLPRKLTTAIIMGSFHNSTSAYLSLPKRQNLVFICILWSKLLSAAAC